MGCDIHAMIERQKVYRRDGEVYWRTWLNAGDPDIGRNYEIFAVLADVRNRDGIAPISQPRGLPDRASSEFEAWHKYWDCDAHSTSWLTLAEIKAFDATQTVDDGAVITSRDESGRVLSTARSVFGEGRDRTAEMERVGRRRIFHWLGDDDDAPTPWDQLIEEMERVKRDGDTDDDVRLVFFFDN